MSMLLFDLQGQPASWPETDRSWQFGDGVFRTASVRDGKVHELVSQILHLLDDARRLELSPLPEAELLAEVTRSLVRPYSRARLKWVISGGDAPGGYVRCGEPRVRIALMPMPEEYQPPQMFASWVCRTTLAEQPRLAGIKHLNRLEQTLARAEHDPVHYPEGLMLDSHGCLSCGISSNVFWRLPQGQIYTHPLIHCGVRGHTRARLLRWLEEQGTAVHLEAWPMGDILSQAEELIVMNALWGPVNVGRCGSWTSRESRVSEWRQGLGFEPLEDQGAMRR
jgi:4-amino-4-deoxychorismate lyase